MNKKLLFLSLVLLLLSSCNQIDTGHEKDLIRFSLYLSYPETKTVNDGKSTKWVLGDLVNVVFAESGTTNYFRGFDFKVTDVESGRIEGTLPEEFDPNLVYDWYVSHPNSGTVSPTRSMYIGIWGSEYFAIQTGNNNMSHLAGGRRYPIVGNAKGVPGTMYPTVQMKNVASVIAFNVRNSTVNDVTIKDIQLKAPELINGKFTVDYSGDDIAVSSSNKESIARLEIQKGTPLKPGETAKFYMGVKPFSYQIGDELICVPSALSQGETLACRIAKVMDTPIHFGQGTITTVNLDFVPSAAPLTVNKADFDTFNQGYSSNYDNDLRSLDGWISNNCAAVVMRPSKHIAPTLSGKSSAPGVLTSPLLANGCSILTFKYGVLESVLDSLSFKVEVLNEAGEVVWTKSITEPEPVFQKGYDFSETVNVPGVFRLKFTNLCPTDATWEKDCVSLYDMSWTNM